MVMGGSLVRVHAGQNGGSVTIVKQLNKTMRCFLCVERGRFRRRAKAQCSQLHKNLNMGDADIDDILGNFWLARISDECRDSTSGRRGRRKIYRSAAFVVESECDD